MIEGGNRFAMLSGEAAEAQKGASVPKTESRPAQEETRKESIPTEGMEPAQGFRGGRGYRSRPMYVPRGGYGGEEGEYSGRGYRPRGRGGYRGRYAYEGGEQQQLPEGQAPAVPGSTEEAKGEAGMGERGREYERRPRKDRRKKSDRQDEVDDLDAEHAITLEEYNAMQAKKQEGLPTKKVEVGKINAMDPTKVIAAKPHVKPQLSNISEKLVQKEEKSKHKTSEETKPQASEKDILG